MSPKPVVLVALALAAATGAGLGLGASQPAALVQGQPGRLLARIDGVLNLDCESPWTPHGVIVSLAIVLPRSNYVGPALFDDQVFIPSTREHTHTVTRDDPDFGEVEQALRVGPPPGLRLDVRARPDTQAICTNTSVPALTGAPMEPWRWAGEIHLTLEPFVLVEREANHYTAWPEGLRYHFMVYERDELDDGIAGGAVSHVAAPQSTQLLAGPQWHAR